MWWGGVKPKLYPPLPAHSLPDNPLPSPEQLLQPQGDLLHLLLQGETAPWHQHLHTQGGDMDLFGGYLTDQVPVVDIFAIIRSALPYIEG